MQWSGFRYENKKLISKKGLIVWRSRSNLFITDNCQRGLILITIVERTLCGLKLHEIVAIIGSLARPLARLTHSVATSPLHSFACLLIFPRLTVVTPDECRWSISCSCCYHASILWWPKAFAKVQENAFKFLIEKLIAFAILTTANVFDESIEVVENFGFIVNTHSISDVVETSRQQWGTASWLAKDDHHSSFAVTAIAVGDGLRWHFSIYNRAVLRQWNSNEVLSEFLRDEAWKWLPFGNVGRVCCFNGEKTFLVTGF